MVVDAKTRIAEPPAFHRLPYNDGWRDINAGVTFLAEHVTPRPFEDASSWLPLGVHLHWSLPQFLTAGRHNPGGTPSESQARINGIDFPLLPNRWLVRTPSDVWWMVESDYVHPEDTTTSRPGVSYLLTAEQQAHLGTTAPFRFVGRQMRLRDWITADTGAHLPGITAVGWGDPRFHTFYPLCWSILGFHDRDHKPDTAAISGTYDVYGYYADPGTDPVAELVAANTTLNDIDLHRLIDDHIRCTTGSVDTSAAAKPQQAFQTDTKRQEASASGDLPSKGVLMAQIARAINAVPTKLAVGINEVARALQQHAEQGWTRPSRMLAVGSARTPGPSRSPRGIERVTVGSNGSEALAAHLALLARMEQHPAAIALGQGQAEEVLEAIVLAERVDLDRPDGYAKLRETSHDHGFVAIPAGSRWTVRTKGPGLAADAAHAPTPVHGSAPDRAAALLTDLNVVQQAIDRLARHQDRLSEQLYADWCLYLTSKYPPRGAAEEYPDADGVRRHIELNRLARLEVNVVEYRRQLAVITDLATRTISALHDADLDQLRVTADDISNWEVVASALASIGVESTLNNIDRADTDAWQSKVLELVNGLIIDDPGSARQILGRSPRGAIEDEAFMRWLRASPPTVDDIAAESAPVMHQIFRRDDDPTNDLRQRWLDHVTERAGQWHQSARARAALEILASGSLKVGAKARHHLEVLPGPRFWAPRDPVLVLEGPAVARSLRRPSGTVHCSILPVGDDPASWLPRAVTLSTDMADELQALIRQLPGGNMADPSHSDRDWNPVSVDWVAVVHDNDTAAGGPYEFTGRSHLSGHLSGELLDAIDRLPSDRANELAIWARGYLVEGEKQNSLQSISLTGFNTAHLMHQSILPLPVADPHGFPEAQHFAARVAAAVGRHTTVAPDPLGVFRPVRAGGLEVTDLRVIDSFGRVVDVDLVADVDPTDDEVAPIVTGAPSMLQDPAAVSGRGGAPRLHLPARIVPPARFQFRWLAAESSGADPSGADNEASDHPSTGPICGWLVPNLLEGRIMVHAASGEPIGSVDQTGQWRPPPGRDRFIPPGDIPNLGLRNVVVQLLHESLAGQDEILRKIQQSLDTIEPDSHAQHRSLSLLLGRPVAVVRASVRLELLGYPPAAQSWESFRAQLGGAGPDTAGLLQRPFPVRFGEPGQLDDGVVGIWIERDGDPQGNGTRFDGPLLMPQLAEPSDLQDGTSDGSRTKATEASGGHLTVTLDGSPVYLTMLVDPRGKVHATTGILPTKVLDIPHEQFAPALDAISVTFRTSSLLSDPGRIQVALPLEPGYSWSWLERTPGGWVETSGDEIEAPSARARLAGQQHIREGWLQLSPDPAVVDDAAGAAPGADGTLP